MQLLLIILLLTLFCSPFDPHQEKQQPDFHPVQHADFSATGIIGVRFDPSYYYSVKKPLKRFADSTAELWAASGVNCVFFMGYDPEYGAFYKTSYACNKMGDFGKKDLMGLILTACHARGIKMMVWLWPYQHGGAWKQHPEWRIKKRGNADMPALKGRNLLCLSHDDCRLWWNGFVADVLKNYPLIDGIDAAEPAVVWDGQFTCACSECRSKIIIPAGKRDGRERQLRANGLSAALVRCAEMVHAKHKTFCLTFTGTANRQGRLYPFAKQVEFTGLDVAALFSAREHPDWVSVEILWQEWAEAYANPRIFTPQWTAQATAQAKRAIGDKALFIAHIELGNSGKVPVSEKDFLQSIKAAREAGANSLEFYDAYLADSLRIWPRLRSKLHEPSKRRALIFYDAHGHAEAREMALLCGHFNVQTELHPVKSFSPEYVHLLDHVFFIGMDCGGALPAGFIRFARNPSVPLFWINYNIDQIVNTKTLVSDTEDNFPSDTVDTNFAVLYSDIPVLQPIVQGVAGSFNEPILSDLSDSTEPIPQSALWFDKDENKNHGSPNDSAILTNSSLLSHGALVRTTGMTFDRYDTTGRFRSILYKGSVFNKFDSTLCLFSHIDSTLVKVYAWAIAKSGERRPYILRSGKLWYAADYAFSQIEGDRTIVISDLLHDFLNEDHPQSHRALVRIEDVNPLSDPHQIRALADFFSSEGIAWSISLVPFYYNPKENTARALSDCREMVSALHYAVSHGAAIVEHGVTHQYRGHTTVDYEFWDIENNRPVFEDSRQYVSARLQRGLDEMHKAGLYPVCFETPHYGASQLDYEVFNRYFSTEYGRRMVVDTLGYEELVPYYISRFPGSGAIIPENCGYIPNDAPDSRTIIDAARSNLAIRDGFASFFYHPWIDIGILRQIIREIRHMGYEFADIRDIPLTVRGRGFVQCTGEQRIAIKLSNQYLHTFFIDNKGKKWDEHTSDKPRNSIDTLNISCPRGRMYIAETVNRRPPILSMPQAPKFDWWNWITSWITRRPDLTLRSGVPAQVAILHDTLSTLRKPIGYEATDSAWEKAFKYFGMRVTRLNVRNFSGFPDQVNLMVVPSSAQTALTPDQCRLLSAEVKQGKNIIIECAGQLCDTLGFFTDTMRRKIGSLYDLKYPNVLITWSLPEMVFPTYSRYGADTHYVSSEGVPVVTSGTAGNGKYLLCAAHIAGPRSTEPVRFPFLVNSVKRTFNLVPVVRSPQVELYFEPTFRQFISQETIVGVWRKNGVRAVYVAFNEEYSVHGVEYTRLVNLFHDNGIIVYAWFDFPRVGRAFWERHPRWREKAASREDAYGAHSYSVNLLNLECRKETLRMARGFLALADWDGINWTGAMYSGDSSDISAKITPMNKFFRHAFQNRYGYDPRSIFKNNYSRAQLGSGRQWKAFTKVRDSLERLITVQFIDSLRSYLPANGNREIILSRPLIQVSTAMRSFFAKFASPGSPVRLQAQLPLGKWLDAVTLDSMCTSLSIQFPGWKPMVELNFNCLSPRSGATKQLCGTELMGILAHAGSHNIRLTLRTDANLCEVDFGNLSYAFASATQQEFGTSRWSISAPGALEMDFDPKVNNQLRIDGALWPANADGRLLFPRGLHVIEGCSRLLEWRSMLNDPIHIANFTGTIESAVSTLRGLDVKYSADTRAIVSFTRRPTRLLIDGALSEDFHSNTHGQSDNTPATCILPAGTHSVRVFTGSLFASIMALISMRLSLAIIFISAVSIVAFLILYALERAGLSLIRNLLKRKRTCAEGEVR